MLLFQLGRKMNKIDTKSKIETEEDFINYPKFSNSLKKLVAKYPDGVEDSVIAKVLMLTEEEVQALFKKYVEETRKRLGLTDGDKD